MRAIISTNLHSIILFNPVFRRIECLKHARSKLFHTNLRLSAFKRMNREEESSVKSVAIFDVAGQNKKEKSTFLDVIHMYTNDHSRKTGHVQFVYAALRYMKEFGVHEDIQSYKAILNTLPKGRYIPPSIFAAEMMHFPRESQAMIDLLQQMEDNGVIPDPEMELILINIVGEHGIPLRKLRRMAYWQGKFKNLNPWPHPKPLPDNGLEIAKEAIKKIATVDVQSKVTVFDTRDVTNSIDKTWIVSASSPDQERLIASHPKDVAAYVEGPYRIWVSKASVDYFLLYALPINRPVPEDINYDDISNLEISMWKRSKKALVLHRCIHEQDKLTIFGVCATGTSTKDSLLSWIRCLQIRNPTLESIPILFKFISPELPPQLEAGKREENQNLSEEEYKKIKD